MVPVACAPHPSPVVPSSPVLQPLGSSWIASPGVDLGDKQLTRINAVYSAHSKQQGYGNAVCAVQH